MPNDKNLANIGTESFKLEGQGASQERVVINVQEEKSEGIILDRDKSENEYYGLNPIVKFYKKVNKYFLEHSGVKLKEKANFFHLLGVMVNSGIPMIKSLRSLEAQMATNPRMQMIVREIANDIEEGESLSAAMVPFDNVFSESEIGMIESGEASGQLSKVLESIAKDVEKAYTIRSKVKSAMMYPIVIFSLLVVVVTAMMVLVIPKLKELFDSVNGELPLLTRVVIGLSDFLRNNGFLLLGAVAAIIFGLVMFKKTDSGKYAFDKFKISIPVFGKLFQMAYLSRFARLLSNLLDSNVSIVRTLEICANSIGNEVYKKRLMLSVEDIKQGIPLAENLYSSDLFPPMLVNMIDVGEKTAQLGEITDKVADFYEDEVDTAVNGISKIIEPIMLIIIGITVGGVVAAIMLPIMNLANFAGKV